uniref:J domain-containing protein n=1 Tax=Heterorhabditis bacteriophora TaxID=37862 RepID=A0A1I7WMR2_HETBA
MSIPVSSQEQIINLNVGGHRFATSSHTLTWVPDSFFTSCNMYCMNSGDSRITSLNGPGVGVGRDGHFLQNSGYNTPRMYGHCKKSSYEMNRFIRSELSQLRHHSCAQSEDEPDPLRVRMVKAHHNSIVVAYAYYACVYRMKESIGWQTVYNTDCMESLIKHVALNTKFGPQNADRMLAVALANANILLWSLEEEGTALKMGTFTLGVAVDKLFFIGSQMVALSRTGKVGIWHSMTHNWQVQEKIVKFFDVVAISCYDTAGSSLLLGCTNGSMYYVDMQKFPLRLCTIRSIDGAAISAFVVHECEGSNRMGSRPRRYLFCGTTTGNVQMESKISFNPYEVLGLKENCNEKEIQKAYKLQCLRWHPDKNLNNKEEAETRFIAAKEAFEFLFDKSKRNKYDQHTRNARMQEERHKARLEKADSTRRKFIDDLRQREKEFADRHTLSEKLTPSQEESRRRKQELNIRAEFEELRMKLEKEVSDEIHAQQERLNKVRQEASEAEQPRIKTGDWINPPSSDVSENQKTQEDSVDNGRKEYKSTFISPLTFDRLG